MFFSINFPLPFHSPLQSVTASSSPKIHHECRKHSPPFLLACPLKFPWKNCNLLRKPESPRKTEILTEIRPMQSASQKESRKTRSNKSSKREERKPTPDSWSPYAPTGWDPTARHNSDRLPPVYRSERQYWSSSSCQPADGCSVSWWSSLAQGRFVWSAEPWSVPVCTVVEAVPGSRQASELPRSTGRSRAEADRVAETDTRRLDRSEHRDDHRRRQGKVLDRRKWQRSP